jgi:hypothetical protein
LGEFQRAMKDGLIGNSVAEIRYVAIARASTKSRTLLPIDLTLNFDISPDKKKNFIF